MELKDLIERNRKIRAIGFDDAPFTRHQTAKVPIAGIVCANTRFEGMVWGEIQLDGWDATEVISQLLLGGKFLPQLHLVLLDGIGFGGFNLVDLPHLSTRLQLPCVAVMRRLPNLPKMKQALSRLSDRAKRIELLQKAGEIYAYPPFYFQVWGEQPEIVAAALKCLTDCGKVPEALRLAHLIGAAVIRGESSSQA
ncbi:endonuclease dU [Myxosarcina sp. GI1(2024)]